MVEKSADAFRNISEVSILLNVPAHVLRFWETRFPQIKPVKRSGGRRYYRPEDISLLTRIRELLYGEGYTIKGAQQVLKTGGTAQGSSDQKPHSSASSGASPDVDAVLVLLKEVARRLDRLTQAS
jgi:DNA-binding transcriptional MerR regulator